MDKPTLKNNWILDKLTDLDFNVTKIKDIQKILSAHLKPTPMVLSEFLSKKFSKNIWLKLENLQPTNSFKIRPAYWSILSQIEAARQRGVVTSSSGNFAQAVAFAARELSVKAEIIMMRSTAPIKINKTLEYGASVTLCEPTFDDRINTFEKRAKETNALKIFPFDSLETIMGNAVLGLEIKEQIQNPFSIFCPVSGGGLAAGISMTLGTDDVLFAVQPKNNPSLYECLKREKREKIPTSPSIADAIVSPTPGEKTFPILQKSVRECVLVNEEEIFSATQHLLRIENITSEHAGSMSVAALNHKVLDHLPHQDIICIISGGNIASLG